MVLVTLILDIPYKHGYLKFWILPKIEISAIIFKTLHTFMGSVSKEEFNMLVIKLIRESLV